jgi:hypothetical protein
MHLLTVNFLPLKFSHPMVAQCHSYKLKDTISWCMGMVLLGDDVANVAEMPRQQDEHCGIDLHPGSGEDTKTLQGNYLTVIVNAPVSCRNLVLC